MSQGLATYTGLDFLNFLQILASSFVACAQVLKTGKQKLVLFVAQGARGAGDGSLSSATAGDDALSLGGGDDGGPDDGTGGSIEGGESSSSSSRRVSFADGNGTSRGGGDGRSGCSGSGGSSSSRKLNLGVDDFAFRIAKAREAFETGAAARVGWLDDHLADERRLVIADRLVSREVLALVRGELRVARKLPGCAEIAQQEIYRWTEEAVRAGKDVVRLKIGDPFVFGRGGEEILEFRERLGVEASVVPGVSAVFSSPLLGKIPVTHRAVASQVVMSTGYGKEYARPSLQSYHQDQAS